MFYPLKPYIKVKRKKLDTYVMIVMTVVKPQLIYESYTKKIKQSYMYTVKLLQVQQNKATLHDYLLLTY